MSVPSARPDDALAFLALLGGSTHLTAILPDPTAPGYIIGAWHRPADTAATRRWLAQIHDAGMNAYWQTGEIDPGFTAAKAAHTDVRWVRFILVDIDPKPGEDEAAMLRRADLIFASAAPPSLVIWSGNGIQCLWLIGPGVNLSQAQAVAYNRRLVAALGGDKAAVDVCRILRVPGTVNFPTARKRALGRVPTLARLLHASMKPHDQAALDQVMVEMERLGAVEGWAVQVSNVTPIDGAGAEPLAQRWLAQGHMPLLSPELKARIDAATALADGGTLSRRWRGDVEGLADSSRSTLDFAVVRALLDAGLVHDDDEAAAGLVYWAEQGAAMVGWSGVGDHVKYPSQESEFRYVARCVAKAHASLREQARGPEARSATIAMFPREAAATAQAPATATAAAPAPDEDPTIAAAVEMVNNDGFHMLQEGGGGPHRFRPGMQHPLSVDFNKMRLHYHNQPVRVSVSGRAGLVDVNPADLWAGHRTLRRHYHRAELRFYPPGTPDPLAPQRILNVFNGWPQVVLDAVAAARRVPPLPQSEWINAAIHLMGARRGDAVDVAWRHAYTFLRDIICGGEDIRLAWLLNAFAYRVQHADKVIDVYLAMQDLGGTGKDVFARLFGASLFHPKHSLIAVNKEHVFTRFNAHVVGAQLLVLNEAMFYGDPRDQAALKGLVGADAYPVETKGGPTFTAYVRNLVMIATNAAFAAPMGRADRRAVIFQPSDEWFTDEAAFDFLHESHPQSLAVYARLLLNIIVTRPAQLITPEYLEQQTHQLTGLDLWLFLLLCEPERFGPADATGKRGYVVVMQNGQLADSYETWWRATPRRLAGEPASRTMVAAYVKQMLGAKAEGAPRRDPETGEGPYRWVILPATVELARGIFSRKMRDRLNWPLGLPIEYPPKK